MGLATNLPRLLLAGVFCSDFSPDQGAAYVRVYNPGPGAAELAGLVLEWDGVALGIPGGKPLPAEGSAFVAWKADAFTRLLTRPPDYSITPAPGVPTVIAPQGAPHALRSEGGAIRVLTGAGDLLDAFVWGNGPEVAGWNGPAVSTAPVGVVFQRAIMEETLSDGSAGQFVTDVGTAAAWRQGTDWLPRRLVRAGQSAMTYPTFTVPGALAFTCPDSGFDVIKEFIDTAQRQLDINLYFFTQADLVDRVIAAAGRGVSIRLLIEGEPYMGMPANARETMVKLQAGGVPVRLLRRAADGFRRYTFDHAKYAIADGQRCLMMSDNWTNRSLPSSAQTGHRGWGVVVDDGPLASHLGRIFAADWNPASLDSRAFAPEAAHVARVAAPLATVPQRSLPQPIAPVPLTGPLQLTPFLAPDHSLLQTRAICGLIGSTTRTLDVQQASLQLFWGRGKTGSLEATPNLFLAAVVAAARRGVRVRVLMDGMHLDSEDPRDNTHTRAWFQALAAAERLALEARILDAQATGMSIHNKGLIVDGRQVLISSINWSENSPLENRELALIIESHAAAAFYGSAFERDWAGGK